MKKKVLLSLISIVGLATLSSCSFDFERLIENIINSIDIESIISNFSFDDFFTIDEEEAAEIIANFDPSSQYDAVDTIDLYCYETAKDLDTSATSSDTINLSIDDNEGSLTLTYSSSTLSITLAQSEEDSYTLTVVDASGEEVQTQSENLTLAEALEYVTTYKEDIIDQYGYNEDTHFKKYIENGTVAYYQLSDYIRFAGTYADEEGYSATFDCAYTTDGLFVAGTLEVKLNDETISSYNAYLDYNSSYTSLINLYDLIA